MTAVLTPVVDPLVERTPVWTTPVPLRAESTINLLVLNDQPVVRQGLADVLGSTPGITLLGAVGTIDEALALDRVASADVFLVSLSHSDCDTIEGATQIRNAEAEHRDRRAQRSRRRHRDPAGLRRRRERLPAHRLGAGRARRRRPGRGRRLHAALSRRRTRVPRRAPDAPQHPTAHQPRVRGPRSRARRAREQADRPPARHLREDGQGSPDPGVLCARSHAIARRPRCMRRGTAPPVDREAPW